MKRTSELLDRVPPQDDAAERMLLGAMLSVPWDLDALATLPPGALRDERHRHIWEAMGECRRDGVPIDVGTVGERLHARGRLGSEPGQISAGYIMDLYWQGRPGYGSGLAARVARAAARRQAVDVALAVVQVAYGDADAGRLREAGERLVGLADVVAAGEAPRRELRLVEGEAIKRRRRRVKT